MVMWRQTKAIRAGSPAVLIEVPLKAIIETGPLSSTVTVSGVSGLKRSMEINPLPIVSRKGCSPADILIPGHWDSELRSQPCLLSPRLQNTEMTKVGWFKRLYLWRFILAAIENGEEKGSNIHPVNVSKLNYPMMKATCGGCAYQYRHKPPPCRAEAEGG